MYKATKHSLLWRELLESSRGITDDYDAIETDDIDNTEVPTERTLLDCVVARVSVL